MQSETAYKVHTPEIEPMGSANSIPTLESSWFPIMTENPQSLAMKHPKA